MAGTIYCLPNLIADGTLEAAIPSAVRTRAADIRLFFVEAAKNARAYLKLLGHPGPISELRIEEIGHDPDPALIDRWLEPVLAGEDAAIVSESGCPGIADPGAQIVARAQELGLRVVPWVGPSSILMTLMASGLDGQRFRFLGYLPVHAARCGPQGPRDPEPPLRDPALHRDAVPKRRDAREPRLHARPRHPRHRRDRRDGRA